MTSRAIGVSLIVSRKNYNTSCSRSVVFLLKNNNNLKAFSIYQSMILDIDFKLTFAKFDL